MINQQNSYEFTEVIKIMKNKMLISFLMILSVFVVIGTVAAADSNSSSTDVISQNDISQNSNIDHIDTADQIVQEKDDGTFTALEKKINNADSKKIVLENDYRMTKKEISLSF